MLWSLSSYDSTVYHRCDPCRSLSWLRAAVACLRGWRPQGVLLSSAHGLKRGTLSLSHTSNLDLRLHPGCQLRERAEGRSRPEPLGSVVRGRRDQSGHVRGLIDGGSNGELCTAAKGVPAHLHDSPREHIRGARTPSED